MRTNANQNTYLMHFKEALKAAKANLKIVTKNGIPDQICNDLVESICSELKSELERFETKWKAEWRKQYPIDRQGGSVRKTFKPRDAYGDE